MKNHMGSRIDGANREAVDRVLSAESTLLDIMPAGKAIPGFKNDLILHAGPPIAWEHMCVPQRMAISNLIVYEGLAETPEKAGLLVETGEVLIEPNHHYNNVSSMCGATSSSLPVFVVGNKTHGNVAFCCQGTDMTSYGDKYESVKEVDFVREVMAPVMKATIKEAGGINLKELLMNGLQMGDELHDRFDASLGVLSSWILPHIVKTDFPKETLAQVGEYFLSEQGRWYCGNLMMGACKVMMDVARDIEHCTIVTAISRNGIECGVQVSGLGAQWFTGPADVIRGYTFPGYRPEDSTLDIGDSAMSETRGFGGTAAPASPVYARLVGEGFQDAVRHTRMMYEVSVAEDPQFRIPYLDFAGVPVGIDIRRVVETGTVPILNTAMAHKEGGHGMIGAGIAKVPIECFRESLRAFVERHG
jgi:hypothetical protein